MVGQESIEDDLKIDSKVDDQNAHARLVLIQLQWLITILLMSAILWLGNNQAQLEENVNSRLQIAEQLNVRMNELDDRLFSVVQVTPEASDRNIDNDWQLLFVQMTAVARLYEKGDYLIVSELLRGIQFQLMYENLNIAAPLKNSLKQAIDTDLKVLANLQSQPDAWELHIIKMREIQYFLRTQISSDKTLDRTEFALQNSQMLLTMAISASSLHEKQTINHYLLEAKNQLEWLQKYQKPITAPVLTKSKEDKNDGKTTFVSHDRQIENLDEVIFVINELLANPPTSPPLISTQILKK